MGFNKKMYKEAFGKINNPKNHEETAEYINQKYKDDVLKGKINDNLAGWDNSDIYYDKEMLKKEYDRKIFFMLPFLILGIVMLIYMVVYSCQYFDTRINGSCLKVKYVEKSSIVRHQDKDGIKKYDGYIFCWKESEEEYDVASVVITSLTRKLLFDTPEVFLYAGYDSRVEGMTYGGDYFQKFLSQGIEPNESYIFVYPEIPFIYDYKKGEYINLYYNEHKGESYLNLKILVCWWVVVIVDALVILFNIFMGRRLIRVVKEIRRLE